MGTDQGAAPPEGATCARCGESIAPGSPLYSDHVRSADGQLRCAECERAQRGIVIPDMERPEVPITQPNTTFPSSH
jgi:cytochrome c peroxidase